MARARFLKPSFFTNDELAEVPALGRLLFAGLWTLADRAGRLHDRPRRIKAEVLPYDDCDVDALLDCLHRHGFIIRYSIGQDQYIQVTNFAKHQSPHIKEAASTIPAPCEPDASTELAPPVTVTESVTDTESKSLDSSSDDDGHPDARPREVWPERTAAEPEPVVEPVRANGRHPPDWPDMVWIDAAFEQTFWPLYPRHTHKADGKKAFTALMKRQRDYDTAYALLALILERLNEQADYWTDKAVTPHAATYVNGRRWEDEEIIPTARSRV